MTHTPSINVQDNNKILLSTYVRNILVFMLINVIIVPRIFILWKCLDIFWYLVLQSPLHRFNTFVTMFYHSLTNLLVHTIITFNLESMLTVQQMFT